MIRTPENPLRERPFVETRDKKFSQHKRIPITLIDTQGIITCTATKVLPSPSPAGNRQSEPHGPGHGTTPSPLSPDLKSGAAIVVQNRIPRRNNTP